MSARHRVECSCLADHTQPLACRTREEDRPRDAAAHYANGIWTHQFQRRADFPARSLPKSIDAFKYTVARPQREDDCIATLKTRLLTSIARGGLRRQRGAERTAFEAARQEIEARTAAHETRLGPGGPTIHGKPPRPR